MKPILVRSTMLSGAFRPQVCASEQNRHARKELPMAP